MTGEEDDEKSRGDDGTSNGHGNGEREKEKSLTPMLKAEKRELVVWIKMTTIQTNIYRSFLESDAVKEALNTTKSPLAALTVLKKICNNPFLLSDEDGKYRDRGVENTLATASKMGVLLQILKELIGRKHRVLVFSQYKVILSMVEPILRENKMEFIRMDGDTKIEDRQKMVDQFNADKALNVFLLSTKVGGLGLNLTGSDRVIIYDPAWNPATDAQAVDRSYRIGQVNDVMVYRMVTCGTIEEKIYRRQISKVGLLKSVTGNSNQQRYFSKAELKEVFKLEDPTMSQTQIQFKQLHEHRVGTNAEFDRETLHVEAIDSVYGISHHDLLFKTCPPEELEENPELAGQLEEVRRRLCLQTPKPRNRRNRVNPPNTEQRFLKKIDDILQTTPRQRPRSRLPGIIESAVDPHRHRAVSEEHDDSNEFEFKFEDNYSGHNSDDHSKPESFDPNAPNPFLDHSNSMDLDDDDATESEGDFIEQNEPKDVSFISNISNIEPPSKRIHSKPVLSTPAPRARPDSTAKRTRTLRKKQNRFLADSESDDEPVDPNASADTRRFLNNLDHFSFTPAVNRSGRSFPGRISNAIAMTPIFQGLLPKTTVNAVSNEPEATKVVSPPVADDPPARPAAAVLDEEIEIKDIARVIRSQPRRKRRKSLANLQQLMEAVEDEEENENENEDENGNEDEEQNEDRQIEEPLHGTDGMHRADHNESYDSEATVSESEDERSLRPLQATGSAVASKPQSENPSFFQNLNDSISPQNEEQPQWENVNCSMTTNTLSFAFETTRR